MFKNMMKYEKAWDKFCNWLLKKYESKYFYSIEIIIELYPDNFILAVMPFFFDDYDINIYPGQCSEGLYFVIFYNQIDIYDSGDYNFYYSDRKENLIKACEKAFKIFNKQLEK